MATKKLTDDEIRTELKRHPGWSRREAQIVKQFKFTNFVGAMAFVNHVALEAEKLDHHPDILIQYDHVTLTLSTHSAGGLTALDFTLAKRIEG